MRNYELVCILDPQIGEAGFEGVIGRYENQLTDHGAEMGNIDRWGLRKLAYSSVSMKKRRQGYYVLYQFVGEPALLGELEERLKQDDDVLRYMVIAVEGEFMRVPQLTPDSEILRESRSRIQSPRPAPTRGAAEKPPGEETEDSAAKDKPAAEPDENAQSADQKASEEEAETVG